MRFEPRSALVADEQGLADIRQIAVQARPFLAADGLLMVEHGWQQAEAVQKIFTEAGYRDVETRLDYAGRERLTLGYFDNP